MVKIGKLLGKHESIFRSRFENKRDLAALLWALDKDEGRIDPKDIEILTLKNACLAAQKNEIAFRARDAYYLMLEWRDLVSPNTPLMLFLYLGDLCMATLPRDAEYVPRTRFFAFYSGREPYPMKKVMHLSDSSDGPLKGKMIGPQGIEPFSFDMTVTVYNLRYDEGNELLRRSRELREYSLFHQAIYEQPAASKQEFLAAVKKATEECLAQGIMREYLSRHAKEVLDMFSFEWDIREAKEVWQKEAREEGEQKGRAAGRATGFAEGVAKGRADLAKAVTQSLWKAGMPPAEIAAHVGIPEGEVEKIAKDMGP